MTNDSTKSCVAGLVDEMTSLSFNNPLWQSNQKICYLCRTLLLHTVCYSFCIIFCAIVYDLLTCVNHYIVTKNNTQRYHSMFV